LVDLEQQWKEYENSFASAMGYYPDRDRPTYQYLEVERREVGEEKWTNITDSTSHYFPSLFPNMHRMPKAFHNSAPDVVAPQHFDPVLTGPIPAIFGFDYRPFVTHSKLANNQREFPDFTAEEEAEEVDAADILSGNIRKPGNSASSGGNAGKFGAGMGMGMGMGMGAGSLGDPSGGRGGSDPGGSEGGFGTEAPEIVQSRAGSDFTDHIKAMEAKEASDQFRLVRFFDFHAKELGKSYEYRMRLWLGDPNNEDLGKQFANRQTGGMTDFTGLDGGRSNQGGDYDGADGDDEDEGADEEDPDGDYAANQSSNSGTTSSEPEAKYVRITSTMRNPDVRKRLNRAKDTKDSKTNITTYIISEIRGKDENGNDVIEEIVVPRVAVAKNNNGDGFIYQDYLQHARPSQWSKPVTVKVKQTRGQVAAGSVTPGRTLRISQNGTSIELRVGEPNVEVAASAWWEQNLGTALPTKQTVHRGDALDFITESYFLHPATLEVKVAKNDPEAEGPNQYKVAIKTGMVVVDAISGEELELPRTEKMRHQTASEILVMDENGNFRVKNDMNDRTQFRNMLYLADETQTVGKPKKRKKKDDDEGGGKFSNGGGGLGGDF
jgi:hypothetical protein